jgi:hypothetical protein
MYCRLPFFRITIFIGRARRNVAEFIHMQNSEFKMKKYGINIWKSKLCDWIHVSSLYLHRRQIRTIKDFRQVECVLEEDRRTDHEINGYIREAFDSFKLIDDNLNDQHRQSPKHDSEPVNRNNGVIYCRNT